MGAHEEAVDAATAETLAANADALVLVERMVTDPTPDLAGIYAVFEYTAKYGTAAVGVLGMLADVVLQLADATGRPPIDVVVGLRRRTAQAIDETERALRGDGGEPS